jgi:hypothetical protein
MRNKESKRKTTVGQFKYLSVRLVVVGTNIPRIALVKVWSRVFGFQFCLFKKMLKREETEEDKI